MINVVSICLSFDHFITIHLNSKSAVKEEYIQQYSSVMKKIVSTLEQETTMHKLLTAYADRWQPDLWQQSEVMLHKLKPFLSR
jgi:hypothetical protein